MRFFFQNIRTLFAHNWADKNPSGVQITRHQGSAGTSELHEHAPTMARASWGKDRPCAHQPCCHCQGTRDQEEEASALSTESQQKVSQ